MDYVMTNELREELLGLLPFSNDAVLEHTPDIFKTSKTDAEGNKVDIVPEVLRPVFTLRTMTRKEIDAMRSKAKAVAASGKKMEDDQLYDLIASVLTGWKNLYYLGTNPPVEILYKTDPNGGCDKELIRKALTNPIAADLALCLIKMNGLLGTEQLGFGS